MKIFILSLFLFLHSSLFAKPIVAVSILPEQTFVEKIAKDRVDILVMVKPGSSPHSYEPKPTQMIALSKAELYLSMGVEFENVWLERFKSQNPNLRFVDMSDTITKITMLEHHHEQDTHKVNHEHHHEGVDPHTWTSPKNVAIMAATIYKSLCEIDPANQEFYKVNLDTFLEEIATLDLQIKEILKDLPKKTKFMVFHPSWGYFANEYNLTQIVVEVEGKSPKAKEMITIIEEAKEENVKVIFTQPEFSDKSAQIIAKEVHVPVEKISPLNPQWSENLLHMAKSIANK
ncbi:MAG: zinc ABC transporter substrate-binding protein [Sulfurimonas sp.]|jgi:zinc transport system substrate-binding protein|nr:zinc ABC transporter substrate-binding protein [Sulfurimonas sp.]